MLVGARAGPGSPGASRGKSNRHHKVLPLKTKIARFRIVSLELCLCVAMLTRWLSWTESSSWSGYSRLGVRRDLISTHSKIASKECSPSITALTGNPRGHPVRTCKHRSKVYQDKLMEPSATSHWPSASSTLSFVGVNAVVLTMKWWLISNQTLRKSFCLRKESL